MKEEVLVSIIIPTLNSEKTLRKCLDSVVEQTYKDIEIIIVDGGSTDNTVNIANEFNANVIEANIPSMTRQTNIGVNNSLGKYIYRVDHDVILPPQMVNKCIEKCEIDGYAGVCVFWLPDDSISFWAQVRKIEKESYIQYPNYVGSMKYDKNVLGARFLKDEVIKEVGMFDEKIPTTGEDWALYDKLARLDHQFALINLNEKHIGEPKSITDVFKKNYNYGLNMKAFLKQQKTDNGVKQISPFGRRYLIDAFKCSFRKDLKLFLGLILYLSVVYTSTSLGLFNSLLKKDHQ